MAALYFVYAFIGRPDADALSAMWFLPLVGTFGAIVANTSGTGGGVVFVPVFNAFREWGVRDLSGIEIVAASMAIQSIGMSVGALRWSDRLFNQHRHHGGNGSAMVRGRDFLAIALTALCISLPVMLATQRLLPFEPGAVLLGYKGFSILLGSALVLTTWTVNRNRPERAVLAREDLIAVCLLAIPGGFITAFFSVGIGELVALYLFIRHYPVLLCTGVACVISSVSVLAGVVFHIDAGTVPWDVVLLAAPGAALGGWLARPIALWLGARRLKTLDGAWIVLSSLYLIALSMR